MMDIGTSSLSGSAIGSVAGVRLHLDLPFENAELCLNSA